MSKHEEYLMQAVNLATENVAKGGGPFGAIIVLSDGTVIEGTNQVTNTNDPTAHAEVTAIRKATALIGDFSLEGAVLYSSCEPCPMCLCASLWARIDEVYFAADRNDAAWGGFDDAAFYEVLKNDSPAKPLTVKDSLKPFVAWLDSKIRTNY